MATFYGTNGSDTITGTTSPDVIYGYPNGGFPEDDLGNDSLRGGDGNDQIYGGGGNDTLRGDAGADRLYGGAGDDVLYGGDGYDTLDGGDGNDLFVVDDDNYDSFAGGAGNDTLRFDASVTYRDLILNALASVELLDLNGQTVTGTSSVDRYDLSGVTTVLYHGTGFDLGGGNDRFTGHDGADSVRGGVGIDTINAGAGNDSIGGVDGDVIDAGAGDDLILLSGNGWRDTMLGGEGSDTVRLETAVARNMLVLDAAAGFEVLDLAGLALSGTGYNDVFDFSGLGAVLNRAGVIDMGNGNDRFTGHDGNDAVYGGYGADTLIGGLGNDWLDGGQSADSLVGGAGDDTYVVEHERDLVDESTGSGVDLVRSAISFSLAESPLVSGALENLVLTGTAAINGTGNALANSITGNNAANRLSGGAGNDRLTGNAGNDRLNGGSGADRMAGGTGNDVYVVDNTGDRCVELSSGGTDTVLSSISLTLMAYVENLTLTGVAVRGTGNGLGNRLTGNSQDNVLSGGAGSDRLSGSGGNDSLSGGRGNDVMLGGSGRDYLSGSSGNDRMLGGTGNDRLLGGTGRDYLSGGSGRDMLTGGDGADRFVFDKAALSGNVDTIMDFDRREDDSILLSKAAFGALSKGVLASGAFRLGTAAGDANDRVIYDPNSGKLWYDRDGTGAASKQLIAVLHDDPALHAGDILIF